MLRLPSLQRRPQNSGILYDADTDRLKSAYKSGNATAKSVLESYAKAEFFTNLPKSMKKLKL